VTFWPADLAPPLKDRLVQKFLPQPHQIHYLKRISSKIFKFSARGGMFFPIKQNLSYCTSRSSFGAVDVTHTVQEDSKDF
jgi:hypothetical protein